MAANVELLRGLYEAFGKGDVASVLAGFDPKIEWNEAESFAYADGNPYVGPGAIAEGIFQRVVTDVENFSVNAHNFVDGGDTVAVEGRYRGKANATGKALDAQFVHVWEVRDGKIVAFRQYTDTKQWSEAMG